MTQVTRIAWRKEMIAELMRFAQGDPRPSKQQCFEHMNRVFAGERTFTFGSVEARLKRSGFHFPQTLEERKRSHRRQPGARGNAKGCVSIAKVKAARDGAGKPKAPPTPRPDLFAPDLSGLPGRRFVDLKPHQCRFEITGSHDRNLYRFCGCRIAPTRPFAYCHQHIDQAYYIQEK